MTCPNCNGTGYRYIPNGEDDVDVVMCECGANEKSKSGNTAIKNQTGGKPPVKLLTSTHPAHPVLTQHTHRSPRPNLPRVDGSTR